MKNGKKPTLAQKKFLQDTGLDSEKWLIVKDTPEEMFNQMQTKAEQKEQTVKLEGQIQKIRDDYTPKEMHEKDFDECRMDIKQIKAEYLTKDDFIREMNKMDRKLDQMLELMLQK